jgi:hypothetical protein
MLQAVDYTTELGQAFQSADQRITGIYLLTDVVG